MRNIDCPFCRKNKWSSVYSHKIKCLACGQVFKVDEISILEDYALDDKLIEVIKSMIQQYSNTEHDIVAVVLTEILKQVL